jgi:hypothetical protein
MAWPSMPFTGNKPAREGRLINANFDYEALALPAPAEPTAITLFSFTASFGLAGPASWGASYTGHGWCFWQC